MKLGGLTWWRNNYGSILQAYALQETLNSIDNVDYEIINQYGKKIASVDNLVDKLKTIGMAKTIQRIFWKFAIPPLKRRSDELQQFVDKYLKLSEKQYSEENIAHSNESYNGFICGSDQIWNPTLTTMDSMYWLGFADCDKVKIAYAPSIGVNKLSDSEKTLLRRNLSRIDAISCREKDGTLLINNVMEDNICTNVVDPTLLAEKKLWENLCTERCITEPYVFVYLLRGSKAQRKEIERFARSSKLRIVTMPFLETEHTVLYDFVFGDVKLWQASPAEFINIIKYADCVITDSFHGTVFSCIYHIPFMIFPKKGKAQMSRIMGLLSLLEIESRLVENWESINKMRSKKINWEKVESRISEERKKSQSYLIKALNDVRK